MEEFNIDKTVSYWKNSAKYDLSVATAMFKSKKYPYSLFMGHLALEKPVVSMDFGKDRVEEGMSLFRIAGRIDTRLEPVPISVKRYENDTWVPLIFEIRKHGIELRTKRE